MDQGPAVKDLVVFDLDQTLFDIHHREHLIPTAENGSTWLAFNQACVNDAIIEAVADLVKMYDEAGYTIAYLSGRGAEVAEVTREMLARQALISSADLLYLRPTGDYTPGPELKRFWIEHLGVERVVAAYDDDPKIIEMYRSLGITAFQVVLP